MPSLAKRLLLLACDTRQVSEFVAAADKLGLEIVFGSEEPGAPLELRFSQRDSALRIVEYAMDYPLAGIIAVDDAAAAVAGRAGSMLGLPYHPPRAGDALGDKERLQLRLEAAGLATPNVSAGDTAYATIGVMTLGTLRVFAILNAAAPGATLPRLDSILLNGITDTLRTVIRTVGLRHGPVYVELAAAPADPERPEKPAGLAVRSVSAAIHAGYARSLSFRIPLVDENISLEELLIRNALGMDISRIFRK